MRIEKVKKKIINKTFAISEIKIVTIVKEKPLKPIDLSVKKIKLNDCLAVHSMVLTEIYYI